MLDCDKIFKGCNLISDPGEAIKFLSKGYYLEKSYKTTSYTGKKNIICLKEADG